MLKGILYDSIIISCIMFSSGFSFALLHGAAEEFYYKAKGME